MAAEVFKASYLDKLAFGLWIFVMIATGIAGIWIPTWFILTGVAFLCSLYFGAPLAINKWKSNFEPEA